MHLCGLNVTDLLLRLWRGLIECDTHNGDHKRTWDWVVLVGATWTKHGELVAAAKHFLPGSFDRPPRNPALKVSSGYKCWEFLTWFYGLAPGFLYRVLPEVYWRNFCMLVAGVRVTYQRESTHAQREQAHRLLSDFVYNFEKLYIQRKVSHMHFSPQCLHSLPHMPLQTVRIGPLICSSQFTMECTIGDLGSEIKQPSKPFENLAQRSLCRAQDNALVAMHPELVAQPLSKTPSVDLGEGFVLLHPRQKGPRAVEDREDIAILCYIEDLVGTAQAHSIWIEKMQCCVQRWGRLRLPNGQICRTAWKEVPNQMTRLARNVKALSPLETVEFNYGEILYYFQCIIFGRLHTLAMITKYGPPQTDLFEKSYGVIWACHASRHGDGLTVIDVKSIVGCVAMIPCASLFQTAENGETVYFAVDKLGVDIGNLGGADEPEEEVRDVGDGEDHEEVTST
ncbi:hypothetical protein C8Q74DRAFT_1203821 [Fomes fomentarius]|nr:hypothetical protein C8Q74DRAFT_1203821 [Fomes fomentarius]